ncbi:flippase, partial [Escherichia coli]|nr:flippase [Escherichia coli]
LITLPYLVKTLGPHSYGVLGFSLAIWQYFIMLTDYGFNLTATQRIAQYPDDKYKVSLVFWEVMICKLILMLVCGIVIIILLRFTSILSGYESVFFAGGGLLLGNILYPIWLFQGKESMALSSIVNVTTRLSTIPLTFLLVNSVDDAWVSALINSTTSILGGGVALLIVYHKKWLILVTPHKKGLKKQFLEGYHVFMSTAAINLYTTSVTVILGIISGPIVVGYFVAADKLRQAVQGIIVPFSQACYPRIVSLVQKNRKDGLQFIRKMLILQGGGGGILSMFLFVMTPDIINLMYGDEYYRSVITLQILSLCPVLVAISNVLGIQTMLTLGYKREFFLILLISSLFCITLLYPLCIHLMENGAALSVVLSEFIATLFMTIFMVKKKIFRS